VITPLPCHARLAVRPLLVRNVWQSRELKIHEEFVIKHIQYYLDQDEISKHIFRQILAPERSEKRM